MYHINGLLALFALEDRQFLMGITGKEYDPKTGLAFFGSRWFNPMGGQFIMPDTFMGQINSPQSLNSYVYARNNPVNRIDAWLWCW